MKIIDTNIGKQTKALFRKKGGGNEWKNLGKKGEKQVLNKEEILELAKLVKKIEDHYGTPQDIEWAQDKNGKFYITQSRPITTLKGGTKNMSKKKAENYYLHFTGSGFNILLLDLMFDSKTYGAVDYIVFYENDINRAYLSEKGKKEAFELSKKLLDDAFFENLLSRSRQLIKDLKKRQEAILTDENVYEKWRDLVVFNDNFCDIYRFYEQPFQQALEQEILKKISIEKLNNILIKKTFNQIADAQCRKNVAKLIKMGKLKLKIHKVAEEFAGRNNFERYISSRFNITPELAGALRKDEVEKLLQGKMKIRIGDLKNRLRGCVFVKENGRWNLYTGKKYTFWKDKVQKIHNNEIVGNVAFPGIARGRVIIHLSWTDVTPIKKGDVLVTGMTNPKMIPLLKKASAIVTDEGGITCHAAIVAREMKKPCIVGTSNATQILKDGDLIEVDAINGMVKILERK